MSDARYRVGHRIIGHYLVREVLRGGMGEVFLCEVHDRHRLALKTFRQEYLADKRARTSFMEEGLTWVTVAGHPNIVDCFGVIMLEYTPFVLLEWVDGPSGDPADLASLVKRGLPGPQRALEVAMDLCRGLEHAARRVAGIVHRDLKPSNVLVDAGGVAQICDFGLTTVTTTSPEGIDAHGVRPSGPGPGTPRYMAPEQWRGEPVDARTDLYAVGEILYELITGRPVAIGDSFDEFERQHVRGEVPGLDDDHGLDGLAELVRVCLAKDRDDRPANATELLASLLDVYTHHFGPAPEATAAPVSAVQLANRGSSYLVAGRPTEAIGILDQAVATDPDSVQALSARAAASLALDRYDEALSDIREAIALEPDDPVLYNTLGNVLAGGGHDEESFDAFARAVALNPSYANAYYNLGLGLIRLERYAEAIQSLSCAVAIEPAHHQAYCDRAGCRMELGDAASALEDLEIAERLDPLYAKLHMQRSAACLALEDLGGAVRAANRAIELAEDEPGGYARRADALKDMGRLDPAIVDYSRAIERARQDGSLWFKRGMAHRANADPNAAIADLDRAIELDRGDRQAVYNRGQCHQDLDDVNRAMSDYELAMSLDPTYAPPHYARGLIYASSERWQDALADFVAAVDRDESFAPAHFNAGISALNLGRERAALAHFERAAARGMLEADHAVRLLDRPCSEG